MGGDHLFIHTRQMISNLNLYAYGATRIITFVNRRFNVGLNGGE